MRGHARLQRGRPLDAAAWRGIEGRDKALPYSRSGVTVRQEAGG